MAGERELKVKIVGDARGAQKAFRDVDDAGARMGQGLKTAALAVAAAGVAAAAFGFKAVSAASDLNETISKANNVFGESAKEIQDWSKTTAKAMGQSRTESLNAASTFGNLFVQLGTGRKESAAMSKQMTTLASDFASFHNAAPTDVIEAMTAAFRGEYDAVQRYVPTINAAAVEQKALAMTGKKTTKELTAQDKALATQKLLYEGAGDALGDFAETSDGLANRTRILKARFADFMAMVGEKLIPIVLSAMDAAGRFAKALKDRLEPIINSIRSNTRPFVTALEAVAVVLAGLGAAVLYAKIVKGIQAVSAAMAFLSANPVFLVIAAITALAAGLVVAYRNSEEFRAKVDSAFARLKEIASGFIVWWEANWPPFWERAKVVLAAVWDGIKTYLSGAFEALRGVFTFFSGLLHGDWSQIWEGIKQILSGMLTGLRGLMDIQLALLKGAWNAVWDGIRTGFSGKWEGIKTAVLAPVRGLVLFFIDRFGEILDSANFAFGWIPGIGPKLEDAKKEFQKFRDSVNSSLSGIQDKEVKVRMKGDGWNPLDTLLPARNQGHPAPAQKTGSVRARALGGVITRPEIALIGEGRDHEVVVPMNNSPRSRQLAAIAAAGTGMGGAGQVVHQRKVTNNFYGVGIDEVMQKLEMQQARDEFLYAPTG